jgi:hypothetical protein
MLNAELIFFFFILFETNIKSAPITNCELNSYCGNRKFKCSTYGNCNYKIFDYYSHNETVDINPYDPDYIQEDYIYCECNKGYSSFDIDNNMTTSGIYCCYSKKSQLTSFLLELFIGFGTGHFYLGNITFATIKMFIQIFLCVGVGCVTYFSCIREHPFQTNLIEVNNNENLGKNLINENKNNENKENEVNEENEEKGNENMIDNKNNESKDESFELEENKENERMFQNFISCPKSKFFIYFSIISFFLFNFIDVVLISFGVFKDKYGEELYLGS